MYRTRDRRGWVILGLGLALVASCVLVIPGSSLVRRIAAILLLAFCIWRVPVDLRRRVEVSDDGLILVAWSTRHVRWSALQRVEFYNGGRSLGARIDGDHLWRMLLVSNTKSGGQEVCVLTADLAAMWGE